MRLDAMWSQRRGGAGSKQRERGSAEQLQYRWASAERSRVAHLSESPPVASKVYSAGGDEDLLNRAQLSVAGLSAAPARGYTRAMTREEDLREQTFEGGSSNPAERVWRTLKDEAMRAKAFAWLVSSPHEKNIMSTDDIDTMLLDAIGLRQRSCGRGVNRATRRCRWSSASEHGRRL
jgi:hypothetical protein